MMWCGCTHSPASKDCFTWTRVMSCHIAQISGPLKQCQAMAKQVRVMRAVEQVNQSWRFPLPGPPQTQLRAGGEFCARSAAPPVHELATCGTLCLRCPAVAVVRCWWRGWQPSKAGGLGHEPQTQRQTTSRTSLCCPRARTLAVWVPTSHSSQYDENGKVVRGPAPLSLALAHTTVSDGKLALTPWLEKDFRTDAEPTWK
ncbi:petC [Symbiodinium sp. CCMP2592]|nr:petC [Symbiodinium sp. CCMP2592]